MFEARAPKKRGFAASAAALLVISCSALVGCGGEGGSGGGPTEKEGNLLKVDAPLKALAWDSMGEVLYGLERNAGRLVKIEPRELSGVEFDEPAPDAVDDSVELRGAGENLTLDPRRPGEIYVPQPDLDQVHVVGAEDLLDAQEFDVGVPPARVALDRFSDFLFALSEDGSRLTRVNLAGNEVLAETRVDRGPATLIETGGEGSNLLWVADSAGVALYGGPSLELRGRTPLAAGGLAVGPVDPGRAYASEPESGRVVALEPDARGRPRVLAEAEVGEGARHIAAEEDRVYVSTREAVVVLDSENLDVVETLELEPLVEDTPIRRAEASSLVVGGENVYVSLTESPYVLSFDIP